MPKTFFRSYSVSLLLGLALMSCSPVMALRQDEAPASPQPPALIPTAGAQALGPTIGQIESVWPKLRLKHQVFKQRFQKGLEYWFNQQTILLHAPTPAARRWPCGLQHQTIPHTTSRQLKSFRSRTVKTIDGDLINLVILTPSSAQLQQAFVTAGWTAPSLKTYLHAPLKDKNAFPVSRLFLWNRIQDLAFSRDTSLNLIHRHHLRLWKSPWRCGNAEVWIGSSSQDKGIDLNRFSWRGGPTTHLIDPDLDRERDFVLSSFKGFATQHLARPGIWNPIEGLNGNLDPFVSDGQLGLVDLRQSSQNK